MTPEEIRLVQESFRHVLAIREQAAELFYGRLFEIDPSTRRLFAGSDMKAQGGKLMATIDMVVGSLARPEAMLAKVKELAVRHVVYGVEETHYQSVGSALLWTLSAGLGAPFTPALRDAWAAAYALLSGVMIDAAREAVSAKAA
jgi:nitric oxide dioxygenase